MLKLCLSLPDRYSFPVMLAILLARVLLWNGNWVAYVVPACNNRCPLPLNSQHGATFLWLSRPWPLSLLHNKVILYCEYCILACEHSRKLRRIQTKSPWLTHGALTLWTEGPERSRFPSRPLLLLEVSCTFGRRFYPKQLTLYSRYTFYHLLQWESNPWPCHW